MRIRIITAIIIVCIGITFLLLTGLAAAKRAEPVVAFTTDNLIRLHVVANSDALYDQKVKLLVRDRILRETGRMISAQSRDEALKLLKKNREYLVRAAEDELRKNGFDYCARVYIGRFSFPEKEYPFGKLPAGEYNALRVVLGQGEGKNWWCILFPPICHLTTEEKLLKEARGTEEEIRLRWKVLEELLAKKDQYMGFAWEDWVRIFQLATISSAEGQ